MKTLIKQIGIICFLVIPFLGMTQIQIVYPPNASFNYSDPIISVPNHIAPPSWERINPSTTPDVSKTNIPNYDHYLFPEFNSANGEPWLRSIDLPDYLNNKWREGVYTTVNGLVVGREYYIKFEQAIVNGKIHQKGRWRVSLGTKTLFAPWQTPPSKQYSMSPWQNITLGPFLATSTSMIIKVEAEAQNQNVNGDFVGCDLALDGIYLQGENKPPVLNDEVLEICEETINNTLVIDLDATDPDVNDVHTYSIISGNVGNAFKINANSGQISVADASQLNPDVTPVYNLIIEVDDGYGGKDQASITININNTPEFTIVKTDITCSTTGSIVITPTKGVSPYQYSIDGGINFQSSNTFTNLPAGTFNIVLKDAKTCAGTGSITINTIAPFSIDDVITTKATCTVGGNVTFVVSGGTPAIEYSKDNGINWQTSGTFTDLPAGIYKMVIRDGGCVVNYNVTIEAFPIVKIDVIETNDITCTVNGSIHVGVKGGASPFEYSKDGGFNWQTDSFFTGLGATFYNISVRDANGCTDTKKDTIYSIPSFTVDSINTTKETCGGGGSITLFTSGGTPPLKYSIDNGSTFQASNNFGSLTGGIYKVKVKDANGCEFNKDVTVTTIPPFTLDGIVTDVTCAGLGTITVLISSPTATMEYSVDGGINFQESNFFSDLLAKDYDIVVRDFNTCSKTATVTVKNIPPFTVDSIKTVDETCFSKGMIQIFTSGGTDPVEYSINGGLTFKPTGIFNNLDPGSYDVVIKDANTCNYSETKIIKGATPAIIDSVLVQNDSCNACQGVITIHATGPGVLEYSIDNGATKQNANIFPNLCAKDYDILITTGTCNSPKTVSVLSVGSIADATITPVNSVCATADAIILNAATSGGIWSGTGVDPLTGEFNPKTAGPGTHNIIYKIGGPCGNSDTINIVVKDTLNPQINGIPAMCITEGTVQLTAHTKGGIWVGDGVSPSGIFDPNIAGTGNHTIYYSVTGVCTDIDSIIVQVKDTINPEIEGQGPFCVNSGPVQFLTSNTDGVWSGNGIDPSGLFDPEKAGIGTHKITYSIMGVCVDSDTISVEVIDTLSPLIDSPSWLCLSANPINLNANIKGGIWSGSGITDSMNGTFNPKLAGSGEHIVNYTLTGVCAESTKTTVRVKSPYDFNFTKPVVPNCLFTDSLELNFVVNGSGMDLIQWYFNDTQDTVFNQKEVKHLYKGYGAYGGWLQIMDTVCNMDSTILFDIELKPASVLNATASIATNPIACAPYLGEFSGDPNASSHYWLFGDSTVSLEKDPKHYYKELGTYTVTYIANNPNYCIPTDTVKMNVTVLRNKPLWNSAKLVAPQPCSYADGNLLIQIMYEGWSADSLVIDWGDGSPFKGINIHNLYLNQNHVYSTEGSYIITIKAMDLLCNHDTTISIPVTHKKIIADDAIMAPNIFTPNKDGINDYFKLFYQNRKEYDLYQDILDYEVFVFDRWGNEIYHYSTEHLQLGDKIEYWDGSLKTFGKTATDGVFFYLITYKVKCYDDGDIYKIRRLKGHVTIQR